MCYDGNHYLFTNWCFNYNMCCGKPGKLISKPPSFTLTFNIALNKYYYFVHCVTITPHTGWWIYDRKHNGWKGLGLGIVRSFSNSVINIDSASVGWSLKEILEKNKFIKYYQMNFVFLIFQLDMTIWFL